MVCNRINLIRFTLPKKLKALFINNHSTKILHENNSKKRSKNFSLNKPIKKQEIVNKLNKYTNNNAGNNVASLYWSDLLAHLIL